MGETEIGCFVSLRVWLVLASFYRFFFGTWWWVRRQYYILRARETNSEVCICVFSRKRFMNWFGRKKNKNGANSVNCGWWWEGYRLMSDWWYFRMILFSSSWIFEKRNERDVFILKCLYGQAVLKSALWVLLSVLKMLIQRPLNII